MVDAHRYTLEVPFAGEKELFYCQGSTVSSYVPSGTVHDGLLSTTVVEREPNAEKLNQQFDRFLAEINQHLSWLRGDIENWNSAIANEVARIVQYRRDKAAKAGTVASGLKFGVKQSNRETSCPDAE